MIQGYVLLLCVVAALSTPPAIKSNLPGGGESKIINGQDVNEGEYPYIVSLKYSVTNSHSCAASILTPSWVLTAAHCCANNLEEKIYTSSIYLSKGGKSFDVAEKIINPNYGPDEYYHNDICLIRINGSIPLDANAQQVKLAAEGTVVPDKSDVLIIGWGYTTPSFPQTIPDRLQKVTQYKARSPEQCVYLSLVPDHPGHICAVGSGGQGICQGDSGGPLTYNGVQVGITSFVFLPCGGELPDYYTRVSNYIPWIQETIGAKEAQLLQFAQL